MNRNKQRILIIGLGYFERELIKVVSRNWQVTAVDQSEEQIAVAREQAPDVDFLCGDVSSILTWKKLDLSDVRTIISTIRDRDVNLEVCRITREVLELRQPIMVLVYEDDDKDEELYKPFKVTLIKPVELGIQVIQKKLEKNISQAINIGFGRGEIIEVHVQSRSHLVDRKLKYLRPSQWHISAIYRGDELIMPTGNSSIRVGDRVVLVGDPRLLINVADILIKGLPQFPLQYGSDIVFPLHRDFIDHLDEAIYWLENFKAQRLVFKPFKKNLSPELVERIKRDVKAFAVDESVEIFKEAVELSPGAGVIIIPRRKKWFQPCRTKIAFKNARKPFLLARGEFPYQGVTISLNGPDPALALDTGIEIARLLKIPFQALYVTLPREMRGMEEELQLQKREQIIADFEGIRRESIQYHVLEGNPVIKTKDFTGPLDKHLLVLTHDRRAPISKLKPNVSFLVARGSRLSCLVIPLGDAEEA